MRRIMLLVTVALVMSAMMVAMAMPAMAAPGDGAQHFNLEQADLTFGAVFTPSGVTNARALQHPEGGNAGGTGGGGATVFHEATFHLIGPQGTLLDTEAQAAITPSGNLTLIGHQGRPE